MIAGFADQGTEDIFDRIDSQAARRTCPQQLWPVAQRKMQAIDQAERLIELSFNRGNRLEQLRGDRHDQYSIRINEQYRICFTWQPGYATAVEITDYHG